MRNIKESIINFILNNKKIENTEEHIEENTEHIIGKRPDGIFFGYKSSDIIIGKIVTYIIMKRKEDSYKFIIEFDEISDYQKYITVNTRDIEKIHLLIGKKIKFPYDSKYKYNIGIPKEIKSIK